MNDKIKPENFKLIDSENKNEQILKLEYNKGLLLKLSMEILIILILLLRII